jgi:hypothetical protein
MDLVIAMIMILKRNKVNLLHMRGGREDAG